MVLYYTETIVSYDLNLAISVVDYITYNVKRSS